MIIRYKLVFLKFKVWTISIKIQLILFIKHTYLIIFSLSNANWSWPNFYKPKFQVFSSIWVPEMQMSVENKCLFTRHFVPYQPLSFRDFIFHLFEDQNFQYLANFQARSSRYCVQDKLNLICLVVYAKTSIICMGSNVASQRQRMCVIYI